MFIYIRWGMGVRESEHGFVAEFCPICRSIQECRVNKWVQYRYVYFIEYDARPVGLGLTCLTCHTRLRWEAGKFREICTQRTTMARLIQRSFPTIREYYAGRLALEEKIRRGAAGVPEATRAGLLREPFLVLGAEVARLQAKDQDRWADAAIGGGVLLALALAMFAVFAGRVPVLSHALALLALASFVGGVVWAAYLHCTARRRCVRRRAVPRLRRALHVLRPTTAELQRVLDQLKHSGEELGRAVPADELAVACR